MCVSTSNTPPKNHFRNQTHSSPNLEMNTQILTDVPKWLRVDLVQFEILFRIMECLLILYAGTIFSVNIQTNRIKFTNKKYWTVFSWRLQYVTNYRHRTTFSCFVFYIFWKLLLILLFFGDMISCILEKKNFWSQICNPSASDQDKLYKKWMRNAEKKTYFLFFSWETLKTSTHLNVEINHQSSVICQ